MIKGFGFLGGFFGSGEYGCSCIFCHLSVVLDFPVSIIAQ